MFLSNGFSAAKNNLHANTAGDSKKGNNIGQASKYSPSAIQLKNKQNISLIFS